MKTDVEFVRRQDKFAACFLLKHPAFRLKIRSRAKGLRLIRGGGEGSPPVKAEKEPSRGPKKNNQD